MRGSRLGRLLVAAVLAGAAGEATAAEAVVRVTHQFDHAWLAAEVQVLSVRVANWRGFGRPGRIRVQVTRDPQRIFRGHELLGRTLDLGHCALGPQKSTADLVRCVDSREVVMLVVDTNKAIVMAGRPHDDNAYRLRSWCDQNVPYRMRDAAIGKLQNDGLRVDVTRAGLQKRYGRKRAEFWGPVVRFLSGEKPQADAAELARWIPELAAADHGRRRAAQRRIRAHAPLRIHDLRKSLSAAEDPELRRQLRELLTTLAVYADAYDLSLQLTGTPAVTRAEIARTALPALEGYARACAESYARGLIAAPESDRAKPR